MFGQAALHIAPEEVKKIAVIRRNGYGDLLCAVPAITALKQLYPGAELTLFADTRNAALLPYLSCYDRAVIFKAGRNKYVEVLGTAWKYRRESFDLAFSPKPTSMKLLNLFLSLLGAKAQLAATDGRWHSRWINHPQPILPPNLKRHQALKCLQLLYPHVDAIPQSLWPKISLNGQLPELHHLPSQFIVTSVSNNRAHNRLPPEKHARIINQFCMANEITAVISGLPQDRARVDAVMAALRCPAMSVVSDSLHTLLHLLSKCTLALSAEGGFMHLVAAVDRPQVALFTTTLPEEWSPLSHQAICLHSPLGLAELSDSAILTAMENSLHSHSKA